MRGASRGTVLLAFLLFGLVSCIADSWWRTLPESTLPEADAWHRLVLVLEKAHFGIAVINEQRGYIETDWKTTRQCKVAGELTTCERARVVVKVVEWSPFRIKLKTDRVKPDIFSYDPEYFDRWGHYRDWRPWGNDRELEEKLIKEINNELGASEGGTKKAALPAVS